MTVTEYMNRRVQPDGSSELSVSKHKTFHMYGPAELHFNRELDKQLLIYDTIIRPAIVEKGGKNPENFFLSSNASPIGSNATPIMQHVWAGAGCTTSISPSLIRKSLVTIFHKTNPEDAGALSQKFNHRLSTAYKFYVATSKKETCNEGPKR